MYWWEEGAEDEEMEEGQEGEEEEEEGTAQSSCAAGKIEGR